MYGFGNLIKKLIIAIGEANLLVRKTKSKWEQVAFKFLEYVSSEEFKF